MSRSILSDAEYTGVITGESKSLLTAALNSLERHNKDDEEFEIWFPDTERENFKMSTDYNKILEHARLTQANGAPGEYSVVLLEGDPGVGKNHIVTEYAKSINHNVKTMLLANQDSLDFGGMWAPDFDKDELKHLITHMFVGPIPEGYDGEIVLLDEIGNAGAELETVILSVLETREHENQKIPEGRTFIAASNKPDTGCGGGNMLNSLKARLLKVPVEPDSEMWISWALDNDIYLPIIGWINFSPQSLNHFDSKCTEFGQPNPRAWHKLSALLKQEGADVLASTYAIAKVGQEAAMKFIGFMQLEGELPTIDEIRAHPDEAILPPTHVASQYAIVTNMAYYLSENKGDKLPSGTADAFFTYLRRMPEPLAVFGVRMLEKANDDFTKTPEYGKFVTDYQKFDI